MTPPPTDDPGPEQPLDLTGNTLFTTRAQLQAYLDTHPARHRPAEDGTCGCGWPDLPEGLMEAFRDSGEFSTQADHAESRLICDLGSLLPSDTSQQLPDGTVAPISWRTHTRDLHAQLAEQESTVDRRLVTLLAWCRDKGHDIIDLADALTMHPYYLIQLLGENTPTTEDENPTTPGKDGTA